MAVTHTPDTDVITARRNAMIDTLALELIGMATDRAQEIMDLANERAHAFLRPEPTTRSADAPSTRESVASPARVLSLPLVPPAPGLHPAPVRDEQDGADSAAPRRQPRHRRADQQPVPADGATPGAGRGAVRASVLAHLKAQPGVAVTVNTVAKAVGKAAGSVGAALESLTNTGEVSRVGSAPKTYAWSGQG
jgi:hypothetical protein